MPYLSIADFKYGMDRRRPRYAGIPGTLWVGENVLLSRGGDVVRPKRFVPKYEDLENTFGLAVLGERVFVFGSADLAASMPVGVEYQRLQAPNTPAMTRVLDVKNFDNKFYVIAEYADGNRYHFYDGTRVTHWDTLAAAAATTETFYQEMATRLTADGNVTVQPTETGVLLTAKVAGVPFTLSATYVNGTGTNDQSVSKTTIQANVTGVAETLATTSFSITGGTFDPNVNTISAVTVTSGGTPINLLGGAVNWVSNDDATATALSVAVNERTGVHGYTAAAVGSTITLTAPTGTGATPNGYTVAITKTGDVTTSTPAAFAGGVAATASVAQVEELEFSGTFDTDDTATITLNSVEYKLTPLASATGSRAYVRDRRMWSIAGSLLRYSKLTDASDWTDATATTGAGFLLVATDADGAQNLWGIATYQDLTAVFSETAIVIYTLGTDPDTFEVVQTLDNTGSVAGGSIQSYGSNDLFYLDTSGVRSLQARDSSNAAYVDDVGTVFDPYVQEVLNAASPADIDRAASVVTPIDGMYWVAIGGTILALSNFPGTKIRGWTYLSPGFTVTDFARSGRRLYARDEDTIYLYGGDSGNEYPIANEMIARVKLPFMSARDDAGKKRLIGIDIGCTNEWQVSILPDPTDETISVDAGRFSEFSYANEDAEAVDESTHFAAEMTCSRAGDASISNMAIHYKGASLRA